MLYKKRNSGNPNAFGNLISLETLFVKYNSFKSYQVTKPKRLVMHKYKALCLCVRSSIRVFKMFKTKPDDQHFLVSKHVFRYNLGCQQMLDQQS